MVTHSYIKTSVQEESHPLVDVGVHVPLRPSSFIFEKSQLTFQLKTIRIGMLPGLDVGSMFDTTGGRVPVTATYWVSIPIRC